MVGVGWRVVQERGEEVATRGVSLETGTFLHKGVSLRQKKKMERKEGDVLTFWIALLAGGMVERGRRRDE